MQEAQAYLAVDLGAESGRAMLGRVGNGRIELEEVHRFPNGGVRVGDSLHWDVLRQWSEIVDGIAKTVGSAGGTLMSLGVDTWGVDFGLLADDDRLVGNPYHYRDSQTQGIIERAHARLPREELYLRTGNQLMPFNSLFQLFAMAERRAYELSAARSLLHMPDLFGFWLTGNKASEYTIASTSQCLDQKTGRWDTDLITGFGISSDLFGRLVQPGTVLGELRPAVAELARAPRLKVVSVAGHDTASAFAAVPVGAGPAVFISSGTWSLIGTEVAEPVITSSAFAENVTNEAGVGKPAVRRISPGMWLLQECRREWARAGTTYGYAELSELGARAPAFRSLVAPANERFLAPRSMTEAIAGFCRDTGQPVPEDVGQYVRCILESLALEYRAVIDRLEALLDRKLPVVHIIGGGSQNALLNQMTADSTGRPVYAGPVEATALGNVLVQAISLGQLASLEEGRALIRASCNVREFVPTSSGAWSEQFQRYLPLRSVR
jgi:rhamnulokinase